MDSHPKLWGTRGYSTYVNVDNHAIALEASNRRLDHNQRVAVDKVADAALLLVVLAAAVRRKLEPKCAGGAREQQEAAEPLQR